MPNQFIYMRRIFFLRKFDFSFHSKWSWFPNLKHNLQTEPEFRPPMSEVVQDLQKMIRREPNSSGSNEDWLRLGNGLVISAYECWRCGKWIYEITSQDDKSILKKLQTNVPPNNTPNIHIQSSHHRGVFLSASELFGCEQYSNSYGPLFMIILVFIELYKDVCTP